MINTLSLSLSGDSMEPNGDYKGKLMGIMESLRENPYLVANYARIVSRLVHPSWIRGLKLLQQNQGYFTYLGFVGSENHQVAWRIIMT